VIPSSTGTASAGLPPCSTTRLFSSSNSSLSTYRPKSSVVSPGIGNFYLAQHLPHDDLNVFVVDLDPLQPVNFLHLVHQVFLQILRPHTSRISCGTTGPSVIC